MSIKNLSLQTIALHIGYKDYSKLNDISAIYNKAGVLTNPGISIFGDAVNGQKATVTIYPPNSESKQPSILSLFVDGNTRLRGDNKSDYGLEVSGGKSVDSVYIHGDLYVSGSIDGGNKGRLASRFGTADSLPPKSFDIKHPTKGSGWRLRHVSLEGPESAVFYRGRLTGSNTIELPYYWKDLVHEDSITVSIQPIGSTQKIIVMEYNNEKVVLSGNTDCFFHVFGERKDVNPLLTEYEGNDRYDYPDPNFNENSEISVEDRNYTDPNYSFPRNTITS